ncbi:hypothetical protein RclHR1_00100027 [Rhizophagus clarus]|uniref:RBR-type E3 ubiquitin transferase n=1 Tax=Rhizophagus clarus TaxID=94130 RepID=A0A2Z6Q0E1_9GLOM|nr:hypothetical protein RclHR1_00100027 [Rhizophagus clarus]
MRLSTTRVECQICFEFRPKFSFSKITANCNHESNICKLCVKRHIKSQLDSRFDVEINCPFNGCNKKFNTDDIKNISEELSERISALALRQTLSMMPEFRWCKNPKCNSGQIHLEGANAPIMTCRDCGQKSCFTHDIPWHEDSTCSDYEIRLGNDEATKDLLDKKTKSCPKCGVRITKGDGCDHMTCKIRTCRYEFCWFYDIKKINKELFVRYDTLLLHQTLSEIPEFRWCKNSGCNSGQIHFEGDDAPIMTCRDCGQNHVLLVIFVGMRIQLVLTTRLD